MDLLPLQEVGDEGAYQVDLRVYGLDAIKKALLALSDRLSADLSVEGDRANLRVYLLPQRGVGVSLDQALNELRIQILDEDLRAKVADETVDARQLILAHAFSNTKLIDTGG